MPPALALVVCALLSSAAPAPPVRHVAVTFDDLPGASASMTANDVPAVRGMTAKLMDALARHQVPTVGFVNEGKLVVEGEGPAGAEARAGLLKMWVDAGHE